MSRQYFLFLFLLFLFLVQVQQSWSRRRRKLSFFSFFLLLFCHFSPLVQYPPPPTHVFWPSAEKKRKVFGQGRKKRKGKKNSLLSHNKAFFKKKEKYTYILFFSARQFCRRIFLRSIRSLTRLNFTTCSSPLRFPNCFQFFLLFRTTAGGKAKVVKRSPIYQEKH